MRRREVMSLLGGVAAWPLVARAQQSEKKYVIGMFSVSGGNTFANGRQLNEVFLKGLEELGWIEGRNIVLVQRYAENRLERLPELAADLVRLNVDIIAAGGTLAPLAAKRATTTIPIVMLAAGDPLGSGLVASLARPGGNVTGMSLMIPDLGGKRLELLKEVLPRVARVTVLWNAANPYPTRVFKEMQTVAPTVGIELISVEVRGPDDFDGALEAIRRLRPDALVVVEDPLTLSNIKRFPEFVASQRLPALYGVREFVDAGGLISYGPNIADLFRRSAYYIDKILKGAKPADLPVQQPTKFEMLINLKAAKALGLDIPPTMIARADEVIE
jgi:putative tryptophan/tyrosine transport system substrate-binding protein